MERSAQKVILQILIAHEFIATNLNVWNELGESDDNCQSLLSNRAGECADTNSSVCKESVVLEGAGTFLSIT